MRYRKSYCSDGFCGALDCYRCHGDDYLCENCGRVADCECAKCKHCEGYVEGDEHLMTEVQEDYFLGDRVDHAGEKKQCACCRCGGCDEVCEYDCKCERCEDCGERTVNCECEDRCGKPDVKEAGVRSGAHADPEGGVESIEAEDG